MKQLRKLNSSLFDWQTWRSGTLLDIGVGENRFESIIRARNLIKSKAVGYCRGEHLLCRPKNNCYGVMFYHKDIHFWTHLTEKEFNLIFNKCPSTLIGNENGLKIHKMRIRIPPGAPKF
jgi:hypothetical protein